MTKIRIRNEADILSLEGYVRDVVPDRDPIANFITDYYLPILIQCGLKGCHTWHNEGAIVRTESGAVTNVGHICGRHFRNYDEKYDQFKQAKLIPRYQNQIMEFRRNSAKEISALKQLETRSNALQTKLNNFNDIFPTLVVTLRQRAARGETAVRSVVERSEQEIEDMLASSPGLTRERAKYRSETVGHIQGLSVFKAQPENLQQLWTEMQHILDLNVIDCSFTKLSRAARWIEDFETTSETTASALSEGEKFFTTSNFALLRALPMSEADRSMLQRDPIDSLAKSRQLQPSSHRSNKQPQEKPRSKFETWAKAVASSIYNKS